MAQSISFFVDRTLKIDDFTESLEAGNRLSEPAISSPTGTLQPPKRHGNHLVYPSSPKRPKASPEVYELELSTPGSTDGWINSASCSPLPSVHDAHSSSNDLPLPQQESTGTVMDWEPENSGGMESRTCYGAICEAEVLFRRKSDVKSLCQPRKRFYHLAVIVSGLGYALSTTSDVTCGDHVAHLDSATCRALQKLQDLGSIQFEAVLDSTQLSLGRSPHSAKGLILPLSVNIYGPDKSAHQVGLLLSSLSVCLQHPFSTGSHCKYFNPQLYQKGGNMEDLTHLVGLTEKELRAKDLSDEVEHIFESLDSFATDPGCFDSTESNRIMQESGGLPQISSLTVQLKHHQLSAIAFIRQRENHDYCQKSRNTLRSVLNLSHQSTAPVFTCGGILADTMGLGKTLTMISAIIDTLVEADRSIRQAETSASLLASKATLVVVSSMQVLNVWQTEIQSRVTQGTLKTYTFHGQARAVTPLDISDYDVVLTTYGVLSADLKTKKVLQKVLWYRVVLDEAHWIRNANSKQHKAAYGLSSARRWCLTGTPIQNRLEDLLSLLSFLHFEPFCHKVIFRQHILDPMREDTGDRCLRLRSLLGAVCLRRGEKFLNLPKPQFDQVAVTLGDSERCLYNMILKQCERDLDDQVSSRSKIKKYGVLFGAIMKLRRLCNHGSSDCFFSPGSTLASHSIDNGEPGTEDGCQFCTGSGEDRLDFTVGEICPQCGSDPGLLLAAEPMRTPTNNVQPESLANNTMIDEQSTLPFSGGLPGCSAKVQAVIDKLKNSDIGSKSLIFSYWTTTLDLLQQHMQQTGISCLRIDGRVSYQERLRILEEFTTTDVPVLLMTIQTGAVGLNLTAANYVHIVEPQWNPSVEEQAIARAVRMGQIRTVTVMRYVVKNSVEENIVNLQKRKRSLAKFTLDGPSVEGISGSLDDLKFVLDFGSAGAGR
ncbi:SNF2 family N-terminal domain-containing protein [Cladorrhinum sp. PSN332]|nr:SNF2 family N-terminal domain-containing protein [Cladorrhinum sp. PSN332]